MPSILDLLIEATESGSIATIVYNGGSKPGASRPIIPLKIIGSSVLAREPGLPHEKTFNIERIAKVTLQDGKSAENLLVLPIKVSSTPKLGTLEQYAMLLKPQYEQRGWNVFYDNQLFGVGRFFKNGTPKKRPVISVQSIDRSVGVQFDWEPGEIAVQKKELSGRERPWRVDSELRNQGKSFSELHVALEFFANEVDSADPQKN